MSRHSSIHSTVLIRYLCVTDKYCTMRMPYIRVARQKNSPRTRGEFTTRRVQLYAVVDTLSIAEQADRQVSASVVLRRDTAIIVSRPAINSLAVRPTDRPRFHKSQVIRRRRNPPARRGRPASLIAVAISVCCASQGGRGAGVGVSRADGPRARRRRTDGYRHRQRIYLLAASVCGKNTGGLGQTIHAQPLTTLIVTLQRFSSSCSM